MWPLRAYLPRTAGLSCVEFAKKKEQGGAGERHMITANK